MRLSERQAEFEHKFAISELDAGDAATLDALPPACPLRRDGFSGGFHFQHDLAADWARFQRLKEIAADVAKWSRLAANPFWHGALRMLGQFLLRQQPGSPICWDAAFATAEASNDSSPLADDVLLDALFLDPEAEGFLDARSDLLFANGSTRLLRLLKRFDHVATVSGVSADVLSRFPDLSLYLEAQFRMPIFGRWPAMARFLTKHCDRVAKMASPAVAVLCDRWLTNTPVVLRDGKAVRHRREFAEIALASAREMQLIHAKRIAVLTTDETRIYHAAFLGAPDLPTEVAEWALEMARRRPRRADIDEQVRAYHAERESVHRERLRNDPEYREWYNRDRSPSPSVIRTKLPPWPLGPNGRVEGRFREAVLRSAGFQALMRTNPTVAGEVLLACIIEDQPVREYGRHLDLDHELGIQYDHDGYATAPWKSPFNAFLQINAAVALRFLHQLVNFSTELWAQAYLRNNRSEPTTVSIQLADGSVHKYLGDYWIFTWSHEDSNFIGQLHSALAALERWLCSFVQANGEYSALIEDLLLTTNSVAMLGVLVNVGKSNPCLFQGCLRPLLSIQRIYEWDFHRAGVHASLGFNAAAWMREGEAVFKMAKDWALAPYREKTIRTLVPAMFGSDKELGEFLVAATNLGIA
jgi:hypothetical protein